MRRTSRIVAIVFALGLVAAACGDDTTTAIDLGESGLTPPADDIQAAPDGDSLAGLSFATLDGGTDTFDAHLGRPLVVNFFAAWCGPCRAEMPDFEAVFQDVGDRVGFLGISRDETPAASLELIAETGVTYPTGWDQADELFPSLGLFAMPSTLFLDERGVIVDQWSGILTGDALRDKIEENFS